MTTIIHFLETMPFCYWLVLAAGLLLLEVMTGSTYLLWPATAAIFVGLTAIWPLQNNWQIQILLFTVITALLTLYAAPRVKPWLHRSRQDHQLLNERGARKVGRRVSVDRDFLNGAGQVKLDDTLWLAESINGENFEAGTSVEIARVDGTKLIVQA